MQLISSRVSKPPPYLPNIGEQNHAPVAFMSGHTDAFALPTEAPESAVMFSSRLSPDNLPAQKAMQTPSTRFQPFDVRKAVDYSRNSEAEISKGGPLPESEEMLNKSILQLLGAAFKARLTADEVETLDNGINTRRLERQKWIKSRPEFREWAEREAEEISLLEQKAKNLRNQWRMKESLEEKAIRDFVKALLSTHGSRRSNSEFEKDLRSDVEQLRTHRGNDENRLFKVERTLQSQNVEFVNIQKLLHQLGDGQEQICTAKSLAKKYENQLNDVEKRTSNMGSISSEVSEKTRSEVQQIFLSLKAENGQTFESLTATIADVQRQLNELKLSPISSTEYLQQQSLLNAKIAGLQEENATLKQAVFGKDSGLVDQLTRSQDIFKDFQADWTSYKQRLANLEANLKPSSSGSEIDHGRLKKDVKELVAAVEKIFEQHGRRLSQLQDASTAFEGQLHEQQRTCDDMRLTAQSTQKQLDELLRRTDSSVSSVPLSETASVGQVDANDQLPQTQRQANPNSAVINELAQKVRALETLTLDHEQRFQNLTLEPFIRSIVNQMRVMYPYPDQVMRELTNLRQLYAITHQDNAGLKTKVSRHEEILDEQAKTASAGSTVDPAKYEALLRDVPALASDLESVKAALSVQAEKPRENPSETHHGQIEDLRTQISTLARAVENLSGLAGPEGTVHDSSSMKADIEKVRGEQAKFCKKVDEFSDAVVKEKSACEQSQLEVASKIEKLKKEQDTQGSAMQGQFVEIQKTLSDLQCNVDELNLHLYIKNASNSNGAQNQASSVVTSKSPSADANQVEKSASLPPTARQASTPRKRGRSDASGVDQNRAKRRNKRRRVTEVMDDDPDDPDYIEEE